MRNTTVDVNDSKKYLIQDIYEMNLKKASILRKKMALVDQHFEDEKLNMQKQLEEMRESYLRGFPITNEQEKAIGEWKEKHDEEFHGYITQQMKMKAEGCCGGRYKYVFIPTTIGVSGSVVCSCGAEFEFQEIK